MTKPDVAGWLTESRPLRYLHDQGAETRTETIA
jgi:hypothetical protein